MGLTYSTSYISARSYSPKVSRQEYSQAVSSPSFNEIITLLAKTSLPTSTSLCDFLIRDGMHSNVVSAVCRQDFNSTLSLMKLYFSSCKRENQLSFTGNFCSALMKSFSRCDYLKQTPSMWSH